MKTVAVRSKGDHKKPGHLSDGTVFVYISERRVNKIIYNRLCLTSLVWKSISKTVMKKNFPSQFFLFHAMIKKDADDWRYELVRQTKESHSR